MRCLRHHPRGIAREDGGRHREVRRRAKTSIRRLFQVNADRESLAAGRPSALWLVFGLIEEIGRSEIEDRRSRAHLIGGVLDELYPRDETGGTLGVVHLVFTDIVIILRRHHPLGKKRSAASPAGLLLESGSGREMSHKKGGSSRPAGGKQTDAGSREPELWALRQALSLAAMYISAAAHRPGASENLLARKTASYSDHERELILSASRLGKAISLAALKAISKGNLGENKE